MKGKIWNIECSAKEQRLTSPSSPFVHTNHFLTELRKLENSDNSCGTFDRHEYASSRIKSSMSVDMAKELMSDTSAGTTLSIFNNTTIARMVVDLMGMAAYIWLLREEEKGWVKYKIDFISR